MIKRFVLKLPFIGYGLRVAWSVFNLPNKHTKISDNLADLNSRLRTVNELISNQHFEVKDHLEKINITSQEVQSRQANFSQQLADFKHQILVLDNIHSNKTASSKEVKKNEESSQLIAEEPGLDEFYVAFEDKFRGTEEEIKSRLKAYMPYFKMSNLNFNKFPVLDIGCGRGEMLKLLGDNKINAVGIDLNERMVARAKRQGLHVEQAEALSYLMSKKSGIYSVVTGFHLVEHIPFQLLIRLFEECYRVLCPGGFVIFETPNPESIHVGSFSFYNDPSHLNPLPPDILAFTIENRGFDRVEVLRLHPKQKNLELDEVSQSLREIVDRFYTSQDYAVIATKL